MIKTKINKKRLVKFFAYSSVGILGLAATGSFWAWYQLNASLPLLTGEIEVDGLKSKVEIARDKQGVATISGSSRIDLAKATGFLHSQERFFQMDLLRRRSAGKLSALVGASALNQDKEARLHQFHKHARVAYQDLPIQHKNILDAYVSGVNQGLYALQKPPFEYTILNQDPELWTAEDSFLVSYSLFMEMQGQDYKNTQNFYKLNNHLPKELVEFLVPLGTKWDQPLEGEALITHTLPGPNVYNTGNYTSGNFAYNTDIKLETAVPGSNNWAISGKNTLSGNALVANDMHLQLTVPNIWYRLSMKYTPEAGVKQIQGVTLPGLPFMVAGSNGNIAWGFTNSMGDWSDILIIPKEELTELITEVIQKVEVKGGQSEEIVIKQTPFGPIVGHDENGDAMVLRWVAHDPESNNLGLLEVENAKSTAQAIPLFNKTGITHLNVVVGDQAGNIGWSIVGAIPDRKKSVWLPVSYKDPLFAWQGYLDAEQYPKIVNPENGYLSTANARVVSDENLEKVGRENYALGARAKQIYNDIFVLYKPDETSMLNTQLDNRAIFLRQWQQLLLSIMNEQFLSENPQLIEYKNKVDQWNGEASVDSNGYLFVRAFRTQVARRIFPALLAPVMAKHKDFDVYDYFSLTSQWEGPLWTLVNDQPKHLLDSKYDSWQSVFAEALTFLDTHFKNTHGSLSEATWGQYNKVHIQHPLSNALPYVGNILDLPQREASGDINMPLVQEGSFGASMRMIVSPGLEDQGVFHMPVGQSTNPLSPYWAAGHKDWIDGKPSPFLPGETKYQLTLTPQVIQ